MSSKVVLLGPQHLKADAGAMLRELGIRDRVALITAGWQEREGDDAALVADLGVPCVNLKLHARSEEVFLKDKELNVVHKARQQRLRLMQDFYRVRLDHADEADRAISVRHVEPQLLAEERQVSIETLRHLDQDHLERCRDINVTFEARWKLRDSEVVQQHRRELRTLIADAAAVVVSGGHVASLLYRLKLFDVPGLIAASAGKPWIAWSAGAMALTERVVLFHDFPPHGKGIAEMLDAGLGMVKDLVVLPDPKHRLALGDRRGIARFANRIAPATCVAMDGGAQIVVENGTIVRASSHRLRRDGEVEVEWHGEKETEKHS